MKILITGFSGFVSKHFVEHLYKGNIKTDIVGVDVNEPKFDISCYRNSINIRYVTLNLLDQDGVYNLIKNSKPDYILHLASYSSVAYSWENPIESFKNNTNIFLNLVSAVKDICPSCRILSVGSSEEYGKLDKEDIPIKERQSLNPVSPYAVARVSQELLSKVYVDSFNMNIIMTRSFNHIGPWQDERFVVPGFAKRILDIRRRGDHKGMIKTGDLSIIRDFVDVRDVVRAYWLLLTKGTNGEVYNICSGHGYKLEEIVAYLSEIIGVEVETETVSEYVRPNDNPIIIGENYKIYSEFGWKPTIDIKTSLQDIVKEM